MYMKYVQQCGGCVVYVAEYVAVVQQCGEASHSGVADVENMRRNMRRLYSSVADV